MPSAHKPRAGPVAWRCRCCNEAAHCPPKIVTRPSLENGAAIVAATGGSTNAALHLPALANEAGIAFTIDDVGEVFARTPLIGNSRPGGKVYRQGRLRYRRHCGRHPRAGRDADIDGDCLTITGRTIAQEYGDANSPGRRGHF